jgi:hypothetical protein
LPFPQLPVLVWVSAQVESLCDQQVAVFAHLRVEW